MTDFSETEKRNAELACSALAIDYGEIIDSQDYARLRNIFAEDAVFVRPSNPQDVVRGVENIVAVLAYRPRHLVTQHLVCNVRVRVETPDVAVGSCRILLYMAEASEPETPEGRKASSKQLVVVYEDRYVRSKNGWRFAERRGRVLLHT